MPEIFLDTNVLAYLYDDGEPSKQIAAARLLQRPGHRFTVSTQVLSELHSVLTRKFRPPVGLDDAQVVVARLAQLPCVTTDADLVVRAATTARDHQLSIWDAMVVEAAAEAGCTELWTEDLATGSTLRGVTIVDPFVSR